MSHFSKKGQHSNFLHRPKVPHSKKDSSLASSILYRGQIFFLYRPKIDRKEPCQLEDVQRFFMLLKPSGQERYVLLAIGKKRLPKKEGESYFAFVDSVQNVLEDILEPLRKGQKTQREKIQPPTRLLGEGKFLVAHHNKHSHFIYALKDPSQVEENTVQKDFNLEEWGNFIISVKNPKYTASNRGSRFQNHTNLKNEGFVGLADQQIHREALYLRHSKEILPRTQGEYRAGLAQYPTHLQEKFNNHTVIPLSAIEFLEYEGTEMLLTKKNQLDLKEDQAMNECLSGFCDEDIEQQIEAIEGHVSILPLLNKEWR